MRHLGWLLGLLIHSRSQYVLPKRLGTYNGVHGVPSQKTVHFSLTSVIPLVTRLSFDKEITETAKAYAMRKAQLTRPHNCEGYIQVTLWGPKFI
jgi:hypothetical protein